jgi:uncharacterized protein YjiS (DUF1127 family)
MLRAIIAAYKKHLMYTRTLKELSVLSDRELHDLGITRSDIQSVAHDATDGEEIKFEFKPFRDFFKVKTEKNKIDEYLAESANVVDLENRLKDLDRGLAPWQVRARNLSHGWAQ